MSQYHFTTNWELEATCDEVYVILEDAEDLCRWWPDVYLKVKILEKGNSNGVGKKVELLTKGWLPYKLLWSFEVIEANFPTGFSIRAFGDFVGTGVWKFVPNGENRCWVNYDWNISAEKKLIKNLTWLLRPIFEANHKWAMRKGFTSIQNEIIRRSKIK